MPLDYEQMTGVSALQVHVRNAQGDYIPMFLPEGANVFSFSVINPLAAKIISADPLRRMYVARADLSANFENDPGSISYEKLDDDDIDSVYAAANHAMIGNGGCPDTDRYSMAKPEPYLFRTSKALYSVNPEFQVEDERQMRMIAARAASVVGVEGAMIISRYSLLVLISQHMPTKPSIIAMEVKGAMHSAFGEFESIRSIIR